MIYDLHIETFLILYCIIAAISFFIYKLKRKHTYHFAFIAIIECYILFLIKLTILPIPIYPPQYLKDFLKACGGKYEFTQLIPFHTINGILQRNYMRNIIMQLLGNIVLLLPIPVLMGLSQNKSKLRYGRLFLSGFFISVAIELSQLGIDYLTNYPNRICDVDDIILNSLGVFIGIIVLLLITKWKRLYTYLQKEWVFAPNDNN